MKLSDFTREDVCMRKIQFERMGMSSPKGLNYHKSIASKLVVKEMLLGKSKSDEELEKKMDTSYIKGILRKEIPDELFLPMAKDSTISELALELQRFGEYLKVLDVEVLRTNIVESIIVDGILINIRADFILKHSSFIEIGIIKNSKLKISDKAKLKDNKANTNPELYLLSKLGEKLYKNDNIKGSVYSLTAKSDKRSEFASIFDKKPGENRISCSLSDFETEYVLERIKKIISDDNDDKSKQNCYMCPLELMCSYAGEEPQNLVPIDDVSRVSGVFKLTDNQKKAITSNSGIYRINAGAGSGKTTVVSLRVVELLSQGTRPEDILLLTFTNKGATEMRDKIIYWTKQENINIDINKLNISTFNSWGDSIIRQNYRLLGFTSAPNLLEKVDKYDIIFEILQKYPSLTDINYKNPLLDLKYAKGSVVEISNRIDEIKAFKLNVDKDIKYTDEIYEIYELYNKILRRKNLIEYQDQVDLALKLIQDKLISLNYEHIIVDEYQDSDLIQLDIIKELSKSTRFKSLMIVGDDSQAIFGFRNTTPDNILNFHKDFRDISDIFLMDNFRSTPQIIDLANQVNNINNNRLEKILLSNNNDGLLPILTLSQNQESEIDNIVNNIKNSLITMNPSDIAVISRTKGELFKIKDRLIEENIPFIFDIPEPLINNINIQMSSSLLDYLKDLDGNMGIFEYLFVNNNGFKSMELTEISSLLDALDNKIRQSLNEAENKDTKRLELFYELTDKIKDEAFRGFIEGLKVKGLDFQGTHKYVTKIIAYKDPRAIIKDEQKYDAITLTTAHTSKGKEFNKVFVLVSRYNPKTTKSMEEEIRVFFVAITRAKRELNISSNLETNASKVFLDNICRIDNRYLMKKRTF